jgi:hypothetical protein
LVARVVRVASPVRRIAALSIGYWVLLLSVGVALGGAILAVVSSRPRGGVVVGADD